MPRKDRALDDALKKRPEVKFPSALMPDLKGRSSLRRKQDAPDSIRILGELMSRRRQRQ